MLFVYLITGLVIGFLVGCMMRKPKSDAPTPSISPSGMGRDTGMWG